MVVRQVQELLERIYDVPIAQDVAQFLLTDRADLPKEFRASAADEHCPTVSRPQRHVMGDKQLYKVRKQRFASDVLT